MLGRKQAGDVAETAWPSGQCWNPEVAGWSPGLTSVAAVVSEAVSVAQRTDHQTFSVSHFFFTF